MQKLPNILSISRLIATVIVFILVLINEPWAFLLATLLFFLASVTDFFDGYLARRYKVVSTFGVFLDLTADKVFVSAILLAFIQINIVPSWIVFIIITREFLVTGLRSIAASRGKVIPAGVWGKQKTFITLVAMGLMLLAKGLGGSALSLFPIMLQFNTQTITFSNLLLLLSDILMIVATIWTAFSGIEYMLGARPLFAHEVAKEL